MRITVERRRTWVPDGDEFKAVPEEERPRFTFDKPLAYRRDSWTKIVARRDKDGMLSSYTERDMRRIILDSNVTVENLTVVEDGKEKEIRTGADLLEARSDVCSALATLLVFQIVREDYRAELPN